MAQLKTERQYTIVLSKQEYLLVGKALRGTLKEAEKPQAHDLQVALAKARHTMLEHELHESQKLIDNIDDKETP